MPNVPFIHGAVAMGCVIVALFFLRFWQQSRDTLLLWFSAAFTVLAVSYVLLGLVTFATEWRVYIFMLRLMAFSLILFAIIDKNRH